MRAIVFVFGFFFFCPASGQEAPFPQKHNIEITVLFPAGSSADITARVLEIGRAHV